MPEENSRAIPSIRLHVDNATRSSPTVKIMQDKSFAAAVEAKLRPYRNLPEKFRPALEEVAEYVRKQMIPRTFDNEGPGWAPLARRTQLERQQAGFSPQHPILYRTGDLFNELTEKSHPKHIEVIKTGKYARIEIGGSSEKFIQNQMGVPEQRLPQRSMIPGTGGIPIRVEDRRNIQRIIKEAMRKSRR